MLRSTKVLYRALLRRAAAGTATGAELNTVALMTDAGSVLPPNPKRALVFLRAAAAGRRHPCATATLAAATQSLRWWREAAARHGNAWAQTVMGDAAAAAGCYVAAARWWWRAYTNGDAAAGVRLICLPGTPQACGRSLHTCIPTFMEVEVPQLAVLWSVYFEAPPTTAPVEPTESAGETDGQLAVYVSQTLPAADVAAHVMPLLKNLELVPSDDGDGVSIVTWVAAPTPETATVAREFAAAFSAVHGVAADVGTLVRVEAEIRPAPDDTAELWVCATFDADANDDGAADADADADVSGTTEWRLGGPHVRPRGDTQSASHGGGESVQRTR